MRALTPTVESALRWFHWTHQVVVIPMGGARYERASWPRRGGAGEQDARLTQMLTHLRDVFNAMLREEVERARARTKRRAMKVTRG